MHKDELTTAIHHLNRGTVGDAYAASILPCIDMVTQIPLGQPDPFESHIGGMFVAPEGFSLPRWKDRPMNFLCQLKCSDLHPIANHLTGHLLFFAPMRDLVFDDVGEPVAIHIPKSQNLQVYTCDPDPEFELRHASLKCHSSWSLPTPLDALEHTAEWQQDSRDVSDAFHPIYDASVRIPQDREQGFWHRFLGHPDYIQYKCCPDDSYMPLLALYSDDRPGLVYGDTGALYYFIRRQDFERCDFSSVVGIVQTC